jgi:hypothetical protein
VTATIIPSVPPTRSRRSDRSATRLRFQQSVASTVRDSLVHATRVPRGLWFERDILPTMAALPMIWKTLGQLAGRWMTPSEWLAFEESFWESRTHGSTRFHERRPSRARGLRSRPSIATPVSAATDTQFRRSGSIESNVSMMAAQLADWSLPVFVQDRPPRVVVLAAQPLHVERCLSSMWGRSNRPMKRAATSSASRSNSARR